MAFLTRGAAVHTGFSRLAKFMALLGGLVLSGLIVLVCISVFGRVFNDVLHGFGAQVAPGLAQVLLDWGVGPINGDFELVEAGVAFCVFAFLPLCQITSGHAAVDIFTSRFPQRLQRILAAAAEVAFALVLVLIAWRLFDGMMSKRGYGETTFLLQFPIWWAYLASLFGAVVAAFVGLYMAAMRLAEMVLGRAVLPTETEAKT